MQEEILSEKSWFKRNWKWLTPLSVFVVVVVIMFSSLMSAGNVSDFATAFSEDKLYQDAIDKANENTDVQNVLGKLEAVDKMAILESTVEYTNHKQSVNLSVRVSGDKGKAKMDIKADKKNAKWQYNFIKLRIKEPKQEIIVAE